MNRAERRKHRHRWATKTGAQYAGMEVCTDCGASNPDYAEGWTDGISGRQPNVSAMAMGANRLNHYERGYIDSGAASPEGES